VRPALTRPFRNRTLWTRALDTLVVTLIFAVFG
jgi:hypothetical protein